MDEGKRPGGLTAMAVLNFIFGGLSILSILFLAAVIAIVFSTEVADEAQQKIKEAFEKEGVTSAMLVFSFSLSLIASILLIISGVGYLKQKKVLGRGLGNAYAIIAIASSVVSVIMMPKEGGGGFNLMTMIGLIYPVLTLALLNTVFKEDFIH